jgi:hypothetical protein
MARRLPTLLIAVALSATGATAQDSGGWQYVVNTEGRYISWSSSGGNAGLTPGVGTNGGSGSQWYVPVAIQATGRPSSDLKFEFLVRSGEIWTRQRSSGGTVEISSPTDTTVSMTGTYLAWAGIQPFLSLNLNIPTGSPVINGSSSNTQMDANLVPTPVFGEGWNFGPTIGLNIPLSQSLVSTFAVGYTNRGTYDRVGTFSPITSTPGVVNYDPGDVVTLNSAIGYGGDRVSLQFSTSYSLETATQVNGDPFYRAGDRIILDGKIGYVWTDTWSSRLSISYAHTAKDWIAQAGVANLVRERANSNGDIVRIALDTTYNKGNFSVGPTGSFLFRAANGYEQTAPEFISERTGWSAGVVAAYAASQKMSLNLRAEHLWVNQADNPTDLNPLQVPIPGTGIPAIMTTGWLGSLGMTLRF